MSSISEKLSGMGVCLAIAVPAAWLGNFFPIIGGPVFAILIGMILNVVVKDKSKLQPGITYTSKKILQYAVVLLGFGMNLMDILKKGKQSLPIIIVTITTSLLIAYVLSKLMKMPTKISILVGVGSSICGGSAIAATAPVIGANDDEIAQAISVIFLFNIVAALVFPTLGGLLGLSNEGFGIFAGTAINDTSSVTAATSAWDGLHGSHTLGEATIVKLTRTLAIIPITLVLAFIRTKKEKDLEGSTFSFKKIFPFFILYFLLAAVITAVFNLSVAITTPIKTLSKFLIVWAMAAIGFNTDLIKLIRSGGKPILLGFSCWVGITIVCLVLQNLLGLL